MSAFTVEMEGLDVIKEFISGVKREAKQLEAVTKKIGRRIVNEAIYGYFDEEESPYGEKWTPLKPKYAEKKDRTTGSATTLKRSNALFKSIGIKQDGLKVIIGAGNNHIKYAAVHNFGSDEKSKQNIPRRQYIPDEKKGLGKKEDAIIVEGLKEWLSGLKN